jgi:hypothetical protein
MNDRDLPNAAARWGASLMTRVYAVSEAGSTPRRLAATGATAHDRPSEAGHPENPGLNLCLFMELLTTLVDSGYRFGDLLLARLVASGLQIGVAVAAIVLWRRWRSATESVTVH